MSWDEKPDAAEIRAFLRELTGAPWLDGERKHWPRFLFHITNIDNAISILKDGELLSREMASRRGHMAHENANVEIIRKTPDDVRNCVRLYFRPRVPTTFRNEGIRPYGERDAAHVPVPIAFVFRSEPILVQSNTEFSDGSLARWAHGRRARRGDSAAFLASIPFQDVYHEGRIVTGREDEIRFRRHAEVIIPHRLPLVPYLAAIRTRSPAELATLRYGLSSSRDVLERYRDMIGSNTQFDLFNKRWAYVETVAFDGQRLRFDFNTSSEAHTPFVLELTVESPIGIPVVQIEDSRFWAKQSLIIPVPETGNQSETMLVRLILDGCIGYEATLQRNRSTVIRRAN